MNAAADGEETAGDNGTGSAVKVFEKMTAKRS